MKKQLLAYLLILLFPLSLFGGTKTVYDYMEDMYSSSFQVRQQAAKSLGNMGKGARNAISSLVDAMRSEKNDDVKGEIAKALGNIPGTTNDIVALINGASNKDWNKKFQLTSALGESLKKASYPDARKAEATLRKLLKNKDHSVRTNAAITLSVRPELTSKRTRNLLVQMISKDPNEYVRDAVAFSLSRRDIKAGSDEEKILVDTLNNRRNSKKIRTTIAKAFRAKKRKKQATPAMIVALKNATDLKLKKEKVSTKKGFWDKAKGMISGVKKKGFGAIDNLKKMVSEEAKKSILGQARDEINALRERKIFMETGLWSESDEAKFQKKYGKK